MACCYRSPGRVDELEHHIEKVVIERKREPSVLFLSALHAFVKYRDTQEALKSEYPVRLSSKPRKPRDSHFFIILRMRSIYRPSNCSIGPTRAYHVTLPYEKPPMGRRRRRGETPRAYPRQDLAAQVGVDDRSRGWGPGPVPPAVL